MEKEELEKELKRLRGILAKYGIDYQQVPTHKNKRELECTKCGDKVSLESVWEVWDHSSRAFVWFACKKCKSIGTMRFILEPT